jgi:hypothetical protein
METEIDSNILTQTKKLSDGSYERIFTSHEIKDIGLTVYNCYLCSVANLPGEVALQTHIAGKKHQQRLGYDFIPYVNTFRAPLAIYPKSEYFPP